MLCAVVACGRVGVQFLPGPGTDTTSLPANETLGDAGVGSGDAGGASADAAADGGSSEDPEAACPSVCANEHGSADCSTGQCEIGCEIGYADCDGRVDNGCETAIASELESCGGCQLACTTSYGSTSCSEGVCTPSCVPGMSGDCDADAQNGCETNLASDAQACGSCGTVCTNANGTTSCVSGECQPVCASGFGDCDGDAINGCETNLATHPNHCGACGRACDPSFQVCVAGECQVSTCPQGTGDCDANANDCETDLTSSLSDCGFCGNACTVANGTPSCTSSSCEIASCDAGFADCDGELATGCEIALATSTASCGSCGVACTNEHGSTTCSGGTCAPTCSSGWGSCDADPTNGCETSLNTLNHCGGCGNVCPDALQGATAVCNAGICGYRCDPLDGVYALRINAQTSWPATTYVRSGSGTVQFWLRLTLAQSGTSLSGLAELCDQVTPEFRNSVTTDRYLIAYPSALFTPGAPGASFDATLASLSPGAALSSARTAHLLGIAMSDPLNGSWPSMSSARASQVDDDSDGEVGITVEFVDNSTYNHVQTSGSLFAARASHAYGVQRLRFSLAGALSGCDGASGGATVQSFDTRTIGCRLESGQDCSSSQYGHLNDNAVVYSVSSASYAMTKLGGAGSSFSCAQVRSAL